MGVRDMWADETDAYRMRIASLRGAIERLTATGEEIDEYRTHLVRYRLFNQFRPEVLENALHAVARAEAALQLHGVKE